LIVLCASVYCKLCTMPRRLLDFDKARCPQTIPPTNLHVQSH